MICADCGDVCSAVDNNGMTCCDYANTTKGELAARAHALLVENESLRKHLVFACHQRGACVLCGHNPKHPCVDGCPLADLAPKDLLLCYSQRT